MFNRIHLKRIIILPFFIMLVTTFFVFLAITTINSRRCLVNRVEKDIIEQATNVKNSLLELLHKPSCINQQNHALFERELVDFHNEKMRNRHFCIATW